jgi:hypothetical protein
LPYTHEALGAGIGERPQQNRVGNTEYRRVRADPQREGNDGDRYKTGTLAEQPESIANIIHSERAVIELILVFVPVTHAVTYQ